MSAGPELSTELLEVAGEWFLKVRSAQADSELYAAWLHWIEADPTHRQAFAEVQAMWDALGQVNPPPWPRPEELARIDASPEASLIPAQTIRGQYTRWWWTYGTLAAGIVIAVVGLFSFSFDASQHRIATARGEQQSSLLSDGSRIELGGLTGVEVKFTPARRLVIADEGEVFYRVEHDPSRPFVVQAGPISVTAIGTAFSVRREGGAVSVVVTEGIVQVDTNTAPRADSEVVSHVRAKAGERILFDQGRLQAIPRPAHVNQDMVWRRGHLRFEDEPLRVVVASLNRYSKKEIVIGDDSLQELHFTGTIFDDSVEDWLAGVQFLFPVALDTADPERVVLRLRR